jgi:hypothetical protein
LNEWLDKGWDDPTYELAPKVKERTIQRGNDYVVIAFEDSPDRLKVYDEWSQKRALWRAIELPARQVGRVWDRLFSLHHDLKRDGEVLELMLGDGIVSYKGALEPTFHPLVLRNDVLAITEGGAAATAYARLQFEDVDEVERRMIREALLRYCELDTLAMVMIVQAWQEAVGEASV